MVRGKQARSKRSERVMSTVFKLTLLGVIILLAALAANFGQDLA